MADGGKMDERISKDWTSARINEANTQLLLDVSARNEKIPYTDKGAQAFVSETDAVLKLGERVQHYEEGTTTVSAVPLADTPQANKDARELLLNASGTLAGAAERVDITVVVSTA